MNQTAITWRAEQREVGKELQKLLIDLDLKQVDIAEDLGIAAPHVSEYLNARRRWPEDFEARFRAAVKARSSAGGVR